MIGCSMGMLCTPYGRTRILAPNQIHKSTVVNNDKCANMAHKPDSYEMPTRKMPPSIEYPLARGAAAEVLTHTCCLCSFRPISGKPEAYATDLANMDVRNLQR